jgi:integrase
MARRRYQRGSLVLRNGVWTARWREDVIADGALRRVRKALAIGTKAEYPTKRLAQRQFDLTLARINNPTYTAGRVATFAAFVERWKMDVLPHRKPSTQRAAKWHLSKYLVPELGQAMMEQIGCERAQGLITKLARLELAPKTIVNVVGTLSSVLGTAHDWGYRAERLSWARLMFPQRRERIRRRFFSAQEARAIIELTEKKWPAEPWGLLFALAAMTGMRAGELMALKTDDVDLERRVVCVRRSVWYGRVTAPKTRAGERVLPLPVTLAERLRRYLQAWTPNEERFLFATRTGKPVVIGNIVQRKLWTVLDELKIERCGMHAFRHSHASMLVAMGAPMTVARDQLGHTDPRLTFEVYSHAISGAQRESIEKLAGLLDSDGLKEQKDDKYIN